MSRYRLARRAAADLLDVFSYSLETFGHSQARRYADELTAVFNRLAGAPGIGRAYPPAGGDVRRHEHGRHVIFYEAEGDGVLILAVVHERSLPPKLGGP